MLTTGNHFRTASEALAHCYADLLEGRALTSEELSAAMRMLRMIVEIISRADPESVFSWDRLREYVSKHAASDSAITEPAVPVVPAGIAVKDADETIVLTVLREGQLIQIRFQDLVKGDMTCSPSIPCIVVGENAHKSEDPDYSGWLVYDEDENSYFPEDFQPKLD